MENKKLYSMLKIVDADRLAIVNEYKIDYPNSKDYTVTLQPDK